MFRVQQEKEVAQEIMQLSQIIQNFAERNEIDYQKYNGTGKQEQIVNLVATKWIVDVLYLSGQDGEIVLYSSGNCIDPAMEMVDIISWSICSLYIEVNDKVKELINTKKISITKVIFKIIPFTSQQQYVEDSSFCNSNYLNCIHTPWFWMIFGAYSPYYGKPWATRVYLPFHQFFN